MTDIKSMVKGTRYDISDLRIVYSDGREFYCKVIVSESCFTIFKDAIERNRGGHGSGDCLMANWLNDRYEGTNTDVMLSDNSAYHIEELSEKSMDFMWAEVKRFVDSKLKSAKADSAFVAEFKHHIEGNS